MDQDDGSQGSSSPCRTLKVGVAISTFGLRLRSPCEGEHDECDRCEGDELAVAHQHEVDLAVRRDDDAYGDDHQVAQRRPGERLRPPEHAHSEHLHRSRAVTCNRSAHTSA